MNISPIKTIIVRPENEQRGQSMWMNVTFYKQTINIIDDPIIYVWFSLS